MFKLSWRCCWEDGSTDWELPACQGPGSLLFKEALCAPILQTSKPRLQEVKYLPKVAWLVSGRVMA